MISLPFEQIHPGGPFFILQTTFHLSFVEHERAPEDTSAAMEHSTPTLTDFVKFETKVEALTTGVSEHRNRSSEVRRKAGGCSLRSFLQFTTSTSDQR